MIAVATTAFIVGTRLFVPEPNSPAIVTGLSGSALTRAARLLRTVLMVGYIGLSMLGVAAIALFLSTLTDSPLAAALGGLAALVTSTVLVSIDAAGSVRDWLPTRYWLAWVDLFRDPILWRDIERGVLVQGIYVAVLLAMAWANFATRDVTS